MKTTSRVRDSRGFTHSPGSRLSIDPDHHVTEAIGDMYGEYTDEVGNRYSFVPSAPGETESSRSSKRQSMLSVPVVHGRNAGSGKGSGGAGGGGGVAANVQTPPTSPASLARPVSPSLGGAANKQYPLNDIDYESDPVAVAQEMSNLQALRRMSMDVTAAADPDLPSFSNFVPSTPPEDGGDPGSVFWVPARLHPELAPQEFSAFLEAKKNEIRRPQTAGSLSPDGSPSGGPSLRRKKSMLSRQIDADAAKHYRDGAERLEKRKSLLGEPMAPAIQLDDLMKDPTALMHKLSVDSQRRMEKGDQVDDVPIIFAPKVGLKRSTATHYRKGSLRRGERVGSRRGSMKTAETDSEDYYGPDPKAGFRLDRVSTEPVSLPSASRNKDESWRSQRSPPESSGAPMLSDDRGSDTTPASFTTQDKHKSAPAKARRSSSPKGAPRSRTSEPAPPVPKIVETPPPSADVPERHSSFEPPNQTPKKRSTTNHRLSDSSSDAAPAKSEHMVVPGDKKDRKRPDTSGSAGKDRKTSWGWLLGDSDRAKEKEEQREREKEEKVKAKKEKRPKSAEKTDKYDNTRLDVLQKSIELGNTGKVVASDPPTPSTVEPQKPESRESRKSRGEDKKDKDSGFLSFFGGSKKKSGDNSSSTERKGRSSRGVSPDPAHNVQPKYYYTRFPIHIERAIYRLSHLKLANPRRPLHQQVLLSNFMYSYLALVQQTQPHLIQQATSPAQQQKQEAAERQRQQEQQRWQQRQEEEQRYAEQQQNHYYEDAPNDHEYVDDTQGYDDDDDGLRSRQTQKTGRSGRQEELVREHYEHHGPRGREPEAPNGGGGYYADQRGMSGGLQREQDERDDMW